MSKIWLSLAHMGGAEQKFINDAFDTNWIVPLGPNVDAFEISLAEYLDEYKSVVALSSGTAAIHLGLILLGVERGDDVICQSFTFAASANPIVYLGATPVFVDSEPDTWNMDPILLEEAIKDRLQKTKKLPKAIILVQLYGMPAKMDQIMSIASKYNIPVLEDGAEALGSTFKKQRCGTFGDFGVLSFNGNKIITTSGGGALICKTEEEAQKAKFYATQARDNAPYYQHSKIGYNYRMSNICAGIGRGQMLVLEDHITRRREIHSLYTDLLKNISGITIQQNPGSDFDSNFWLSCILVDSSICGVTNNDIRIYLENNNIESRLFWKPMHLQPVFWDTPFYSSGISQRLFEIGLCLPSGSSLTDEQIKYVVEKIKECITQKKTN